MTVTQLMAALHRGTLQAWQVIAALEAAPHNWSVSAARSNVQNWLDLATTVPGWKDAVLAENPEVAPPPAVPPPPVMGPPAPGAAGGVTAPGWGPEAEYLQSIGQGVAGYRNPAQTYQANLYDSLRTLWQQEQKFNPQLGRAGAADWMDYIPQMGVGTSGYGGIASRAKDLLTSLLGMSPTSRTAGGLTTEEQYEPVSGNAYQFGAGEMTPADLASLVEMGGASNFGRLGARYVAGRLPEMRKQWGAAGAGGNQPLTFLDYFKQRYSL